MNGREQRRAMILTGVIEGRLTAVQAAELMTLSERQERRLRRAFLEQGPAALVHGNRGRKPAHTLDAGLREEVVTLAEGLYNGCNDQHFTELLAEREGISLSRSSVRRIRRAAGLRSPRRRRAPRHRARRERMPQAGMLLQFDGSRHQWLGPDGPWLTLVGAIDDATGDVPSALFREQEDAHGYLLLLRQIVRKRGVPLSVYSDRHSIWSARSFFSRQFSSSSAFSRRASLTERSPYLRFQLYSVWSLIPSRRQSSPAGVPAACSLRAATICSSVKRLLFNSSPPFVR